MWFTDQCLDVYDPDNGVDVSVVWNYTDGTAINSLPTYDVTQGNQNTLDPQQLPNYNAMYRQDTTPLVGAATPGGTTEGFSEPMAANSVLGGGSK